MNYKKVFLIWGLRRNAVIKMLINFLSFCTKNNLLALFAWAGLAQVVSLWWVTAEKFVYRQ